MVAPCNLGGNVQGFKVFKVILYIKYTKYGVSKTPGPTATCSPEEVGGHGFKGLWVQDLGGLSLGLWVPILLQIASTGTCNDLQEGCSLLAGIRIKS